MVILFFLFVFIILFLSTILILYTSIEIHIDNLKFSTTKINESHLNKDCKIIVYLKLLDKINILKIDLTKLKGKKEKLTKGIEKIQNKVKNSKNKFDIKMLKALKYSEIKKFRLKVQIGIDDAALNAIFVGIASTVLAISLRNLMANENKTFWEITPIYQNKNIIKAEFDGIFKVKIIHIINEISNLKRKNKNDFNNDKNLSFISSK